MVFSERINRMAEYLDSKRSAGSIGPFAINESSAALTFTAGTKSNWSDNDLTESRLFVK